MSDHKDFTENYFVNSDGAKLYRQIYKPESDIKALLFLCHGMFEHCQSWYYETIIIPLRNIGCIVLTHDHLGHGRSDGPRGLISNLDLLVRDVLLDIEKTKNELQIPDEIPVFLYGHSLGGLISVLASTEKKNYFSGMILEAPALKININKASIGLIRFINFIYPLCPLRKSNPSQICRNENHVKDIQNDSLQVHSMLSAMTAVSVADAIRKCKHVWKDVNTAVFIGHGEADLLTVAKGSQAFMEKISSTDKTLILYPNARHRLRMEIDNVDIDFREKILAWMKERI